MSYLEPPPLPAPVIVIKDVGGPVAVYQSQTAIYRASEREVRLHECRSACTIALGLPNVCVYPGSVLKFHLAYDPRNHQTNPEVSQQLFDSYPAAVRARLGTLTRSYKVLSGSELIKLGIRDCNEPKTNEPTIMVASAAAGKPPLAAQPGAEKPLLAGLMDKMLSVFGAGGAAGHDRLAVLSRPAAKPALAEVLLTEIPLPPARPVELTQTAGAFAVQAPGRQVGEPAGQPATEPALAEAAQAGPPAARRPPDPALSAVQRLARVALPKIIAGAQPILPPGFSAYADMDR
ncbi:MAG: hypothetical protein M3178_08260 [Pseudomonadota bacterium]|nr:hypothetical protein [Pseudomonadota bacterium]